MFKRWKNLWRRSPSKAGPEIPAESLTTPMPAHVAIIMDGNGRWATKRGLPRTLGHREGVNKVREVTREAARLGIKVLTLYAFSTENWKRPEEEVGFLMNLLEESLVKEIEELHKNNVVVRVSGRIHELPPALREGFHRAEEKTQHNTGLILNIALNYGGRAEIVDAARRIAAMAREGKVAVDEIDEEFFSRYLYTAGLPDPDLLIRPSGEMRLSNFLLWQSAYAELYMTPVLWPDFGPAELREAIRAFQKRQRRFGGLGV